MFIKIEKEPLLTETLEKPKIKRKLKRGENLLRKAFKGKIDVEPLALAELTTMSACLVHIWNLALTHCRELLQKRQEQKKAGIESGNSPPITAYTLNYWLTGARRSKTIQLKDGRSFPVSSMGSDPSREILRKLAGSFQSYFNLRKNGDTSAWPPKEKEEHWFQTLSWSSFSICDGVLTVPAINKARIRISIPKYLLRMIVGKMPKHVTLAKNADGEFLLNIVCSTGTIPPVPEKPEFVRAIDIGAGDIAVTDSDGSEFLIPARRSDKFWRKRVGDIEESAKNRNKGSRAYRSLMQRRRKIWNSVSNHHTDHQRRVADAIVDRTKVDCIVLGKARTRLGLSQSAHGTADQHWGSQNTGFMNRLPIFIKEKAQERGVLVIELPDPPRRGEMRPDEKFNATRRLLEVICDRFRIKKPQQFLRKGFKINWGDRVKTV